MRNKAQAGYSGVSMGANADKNRWMAPQEGQPEPADGSTHPSCDGGCARSRTNEQKLRTFMEQVPGLVLIKDAAGNLTDANKEYDSVLKELGHGPRATATREPVPPELAAVLARMEARFLEGGSPTIEEYELELGGEPRAYQWTHFQLPAMEGESPQVGTIGIDITRRKNAEAERERTAARYESLVANLPVGIYRTRLEEGGPIVTANLTMATLLGFESPGELQTRRAVDLYDDPRDRKRFLDLLFKQGKVEGLEVRLRRKDETLIWGRITATTVRGPTGDVQYIDGMIEDISALKHNASMLRHQAHYDAITELPNRCMFRERLNQELARARRHDYLGAVLLLDINGFKNINQACGFEVGDELLQKVGLRLRQLLRQEDIAARVGGDVFAILLLMMDKDSARVAPWVQSVATKVAAALARPFRVKGADIHLTVSIGVTLFPHGDGGGADILRHAETALCQAKQEGRNSIRFLSDETQKAVRWRLALLNDLYVALEKGGIELYFQPQVDGGGALLGAEVLARWRHPVHGLLSPVHFIPLAEEHGLILQLGEWIMGEACRQFRQWLDSGLGGLLHHLAINVSARQLKAPGFVELVENILEEHGVAPHLLELELTENSLLGDVEDAVGKMNALKALGVRISIDDFGTGYSSLAYLKRLPLDVLKIDRSFVHDVNSQHNDAVIVETILSMARHLGLRVVAEGVEVAAELEFLVERGCQIYQGYFFSPPLDVTAFTDYLSVRCLR